MLRIDTLYVIQHNIQEGHPLYVIQHVNPTRCLIKFHNVGPIEFDWRNYWRSLQLE